MKMDKQNEKNMIALGVIAVIVVMAGALALTLNGPMLQGYFSLRGVPTTDTSRQLNPNGLNFKPLTLEPLPLSPEPVGAGQAVNRAEMAKLVVTAMGVDLYTPLKATFKDVAPNAWYYAYVETANRYGWMNGYKDATGQLMGYFGPSDIVNRAQAAKIFSVSVLQGCKNAHTYTGSRYYQDVTVQDWFYEPVIKMADCKMVDVLPGPHSKYWPDYPLSKKRALFMIQNAVKQGWI